MQGPERPGAGKPIFCGPGLALDRANAGGVPEKNTFLKLRLGTQQDT